MDAFQAIAALGDETRRALYRCVAAAGRPVSRDDVAAMAGVPHHVARFHLDRLHAAGLLEAEFRRPAGRGGPGAGHPTKLYRPAPGELLASVPERRYDLAGVVMARALEAAAARDVPVGEALRHAAADAGREIGRHAGARRRGPEPRRPELAGVVTALADHGFEPRPDGGRLVLSNCPFRALAREAPGVVCGMNLALVQGVLEGAGAGSASARLEPGEGRCCVTVVDKEGTDDE